ncbi:hypothetical protein GCM10010400_03270 [Streptomyces aculeolatus]|nr:hypothetical protein [Streptomyces aculeolatus]
MNADLLKDEFDLKQMKKVAGTPEEMLEKLDIGRGDRPKGR